MVGAALFQLEGHWFISGPLTDDNNCIFPHCLCGFPLGTTISSHSPEESQ